ncbi:methyltransferase FkbM [Paenibacillus senegalensis]|uniref:methyltransferase FkbM n=1 Tax=Paenibacillus senegalensis TaxID=1465766 RepID=UPI000287BF2C|nr:methyltransferase FkbM [Paenibacillus senegalensis]
MSSGTSLPVPVALFIFKRPEITELVFNRIREARPARLLVIADGPRPDYPGEAELCEATRRIVDRVDWPCQVAKLFSPVNMGLNARLVSGLNWVFSQVEEAIILEDDCLPHPSFFRFCAELLDKYREDERIMMISGNNFQDQRRLGSSYYFSRIFHIWGWATWRRAWHHYDDSLRMWPEFGGRGWISSVTPDVNAQRFFSKMFQDHLDGKHVLSWDYRWNLSCWLQNGLSIMPNVNLVTNVGFGQSSTYAHDSDSGLSNLPVGEIGFPLTHPHFVVPDPVADQHTMERQFYLPLPVVQEEPSAEVPPALQPPAAPPAILSPPAVQGERRRSSRQTAKGRKGSRRRQRRTSLRGSQRKKAVRSTRSRKGGTGRTRRRRAA